MASGPLSRAEKVYRDISSYRNTPENIAAIDFGTTSISLSYYITVPGDSEEPKIYDWAASNKRVSNAILFKKESSHVSVAAFGDTAYKQFEKITSRSGSSRARFMFFERIKMLLKRDQDIKRDLTVESFNGDKVYLVELIAFIMKHTKEKLIERLSRRASKAHDFHWVITVPAIWDVRGKRMMREAAYLAGLTSCDNDKGIQSFTPVEDHLKHPPEINPDKLLLALEPEVAAIYCQQVEPLETAGLSIPKSQFYAVLDIGGGTVDITVQEKTLDGDIIVKSFPEGNDWGGTKVNKQFALVFEKIVGDPKFSQLLASSDATSKLSLDLNKLLYEEFEGEKKSFGDGNLVEDEMVICIPTSIVEFYGCQTIEDGVKSMPGISFDKELDTGALILSSKAIEDIFHPAVDGIIECINTTLDSIDTPVDTYYLVGGFGGCKYLYNKLTPVLQKRSIQCQLKIPLSPELAVVYGAVLWRRHPKIITARRAEATFGIEVAMPFDATKHDPSYSVHLDEQQVVCKDVFQVFILKDEVTQSNEVIRSGPIRPITSSQNRMVVNILCSSRTDIQYTKDKYGKDTAKKIGQIVADVPSGDSECRRIIVEMSFNQTEILARVESSSTGKVYQTCCDFLS